MSTVRVVADLLYQIPHDALVHEKPAPIAGGFGEVHRVTVNLVQSESAVEVHLEIDGLCLIRRQKIRSPGSNKNAPMHARAVRFPSVRTTAPGSEREPGGALF